jgi:membrane fusion protein (multidrug efflux system)
MRAAVDEEDITSVQPGQQVHMSLYAFEGQILDGQVERIYDQADENRRTFEVDVRLSQPRSELHPGMTGELAFVLQSRDQALVVPSQAVQNGAVYVVRRGRVERIEAEVGLRSIERTEIVSGLQRGERVIISPLGSIGAGRAVREIQIDPDQAAGLNAKEIEEQPFKAFD